MNSTIKFTKDTENKQIIVTHCYEKPIETIWNAFTKTEILEKWWAPEPYKAIVVTNNFVQGGILFYYMLSPEGQKHYCLAEFIEIDRFKYYKVLDAFCDENGVINTQFPRMSWLNKFSYRNGVTTVTNTLVFETAEDMAKLLELGFEGGYKMGLNQLYKLINQHN